MRQRYAELSAVDTAGLGQHKFGYKASSGGVGPRAIGLSREGKGDLAGCLTDKVVVLRADVSISWRLRCI